MTTNTTSAASDASRSDATGPSDGGTHVLYLSSSTSGPASFTDRLAAELLGQLEADLGTATVTRRDLRNLPLLTEASTVERGLPAEQRSETGRRDLAIGDELIEELLAADVLVIGAPIYNFGPPASLKAWADLVGRPGATFGYAEAGPHGLVADRPAYIVSASGGTPIGGQGDFATPWLRQFLGFIGITNVTVIGAQGVAVDPEQGLAGARKQLAALSSVAS